MTDPWDDYCDAIGEGRDADEAGRIAYGGEAHLRREELNEDAAAQSNEDE